MVLALTACVKHHPTVTKNNEQEFATIDPSPANRLQGQELTTPLLKYTDSITKVYPNFYENILAAEKMTDDFKARLGDMPGILKGSVFSLHEVSDAGGFAVVEFVLDDNTIDLYVHCVGFDREKASKLSETKRYIITGGKVIDYLAPSYTTDISIDLGGIYVKDLQVEETK